jgi:hypothetical protein
MQTSTVLATTSSNAISTNDWDTVSALTYTAVNEAIVAQNVSPNNFMQLGSSGLIGTYTVSADFGDWQIALGGDGKNVWMNLPMNHGTAIFEALGQTYAFSGTATIEVTLTYLPQPGSTTSQQLVVNDQSSDSTPPVSVHGITFDGSLDPTVESIISGALLEWLTNNLSAFTNVFAVADLNVVLAGDEAGFQWMQPTYVSYAVTDNGTMDSSVFGVLAMTQNRTAPTAHQVSPDAIPAGCNGGFLVTQELFLTQMVLPGTYLLFNNASSSDFQVYNQNTEVTNLTPLSFDLSDDDGNVYTATVNTQNFKITVLGEQLTIIFTDLTYESGLGVYTHINYQGVYVVAMNSSHQLQMNMVGTPTLRTTVTLSNARKWTDIGIEVAVSIAGAVVGAFVGGLVSAGATAMTEAAVDSTSTALADGFTEAAADGSSEVVANTALDGFSDTMVNAPEQVAADAADSAPEVADAAADGGKPAKGKGWLRRNGTKIFGSMIGGAAGAVVGQIPNILTNIGTDPSDYPTLDSFAEQAISVVEWPNSTGYEMESATLNGALQIGFTYTIA